MQVIYLDSHDNKVKSRLTQWQQVHAGLGLFKPLAVPKPSDPKESLYIRYLDASYMSLYYCKQDRFLSKTEYRSVWVNNREAFSVDGDKFRDVEADISHLGSKFDAQMVHQSGCGNI